MLLNRETESSQGDGCLIGRYANYFKVGHNASEFLVEFGQFHPENGKAQVHSRIIICPCYAKVLLETLQRSIDHFEITFGVIPLDNPGLELPDPRLES